MHNIPAIVGAANLVRQAAITALHRNMTLQKALEENAAIYTQSTAAREAQPVLVALGALGFKLKKAAS